MVIRGVGGVGGSSDHREKVPKALRGALMVEEKRSAW